MNNLDYLNECQITDYIDVLRKEVIQALRRQGFMFCENSNSISLIEHSKDVYKNVQRLSTTEKMKKHKKFIEDNFNIVKKYTINGSELDPEKISLELRLVSSQSLEEKIFKWWNFTWWSVPYERAYGRQMRWVLWDKYHNAPFGLVGLHSPGLSLSARDNYLGVNRDDKDWWINQSMSAQRVGALPPYNELIGGKMVALTLSSKEIRQAYKTKYNKKKSIIKQRILPARLLFITTTGAFGKSSIYNRLKFGDIEVAKLIGYTKGSGTFHINDELYEKLILLLQENGMDTNKGFGNGPSRKRQLISKAFDLLGIKDFQYHGIKRSIYLFSHCSNIHEVIQNNDEPNWYEWSFEKLFNFWKSRWCIPRSKRINRWKNFKADAHFEKIEELLGEL